MNLQRIKPDMTKQIFPFANWLFALAGCLITTAALAQSTHNNPDDRVFKTEQYTVRAVSVVEGLYHPWGMAFLPDGRMILTERRGTMRLFENGKLVESPIEGIPQVKEHGQGG